MSSRNTGIVGYGGTRRSYRSVTCNTGALKEAKLPSSELSNSNTYRRSTEQISIPQASSSTTIGIRLFLKRPSSLGTGYPPFGVKVIDSCFERLMSAIVVAPMIAVLAMIIGCSILDDAGETDYQPLFIAARMGALGGPIAALFCVLISAALSQDQALEESIEPIEVIQLRRKLEGVRTCWGFITPYMIGMGGGPIGSGILRATNLAQTISPRSAVKATAIGGLFATPIYYLVTYLLLIVLRPCTSDDSSEDNEAEKTTARSMSSA
ncbi:hypothetical protein MJO29_005932 [Puccinia striiformis f. sp. tritici]|nr:hypothetical protein MJO29_005932 [Puccinia striiformis f. sp. tritici]